MARSEVFFVVQFLDIKKKKKKTEAKKIGQSN